MAENTKSRGGKRIGAGRKSMELTDKKRTRSIVLTDAEYEKLAQLAKEKGLTRSSLISEWINKSAF